MKECNKCGLVKATDQYYTNTNGNLLNLCKDCRKQQIKNRRYKISLNTDKNIVALKACYKCSTQYSADLFYKNKYRIDGLADECIICAKNKTKINRSLYSTATKDYKIKADKTCTFCKINQNIINFNKNRSSNDGYATECRLCVIKYLKQYRKRNFKPGIKKKFFTKNKRIIYGHIRRAHKRGLIGERFSKIDIIVLYGDSCVYCGGPFEHIDHYIPISKNGPHILTNVRPSCENCNLRKGSKMPEEWNTFLKNKEEI